MTCLEFEDVVHEITRNTDVVSPWQRGLDHAQGCDRCAVLLAEARAVHASLRTLAGADGGKQAGAGVEEALRMAFRKNRVVVPASPRWRQWALGGMILAGAAAVVLALLLGFHGGLNHPQQAFTGNTAAQPSAGAPMANEASGAPGALPAAPEPAPATNSVQMAAVAVLPAGANSTLAVESANASDGVFTPLPDSDDSLPLEGGAVIRVTMQKSLLESFGLQVSDDDASRSQPTCWWTRQECRARFG
jgi:hypothetical protein